MNHLVENKVAEYDEAMDCGNSCSNSCWGNCSGSCGGGANNYY